MNYYNEIDEKAAAWLRELIKQGLIPDGVVDTRSIVDVQPSDLTGYVQCHFFAGIGGWSYALQLAGWPADRPVWTGSCPCQPFSSAGAQRGFADERHLWPHFHRLIAQCQPPTVFGEQVASNLGRQWLAGVRTDLEAVGYAVGGADLCAAGVGSPQIRQRLYWVADTGHEQTWRSAASRDTQSGRSFSNLAGCSPVGGMADSANRGQRIDGSPPRQTGYADECGEASGVARTSGERSDGLDPLLRPEEVGRNGASEVFETSRCRVVGGLGHHHHQGPQGRRLRPERDAGSGSPWSSSFDVIACTDGRARRVESGTFPLAYGVPARVGRLRGYGNAIVPQVAAVFIQASEESRVRLDLI